MLLLAFRNLESRHSRKRSLGSDPVCSTHAAVSADTRLLQPDSHARGRLSPLRPMRGQPAAALPVVRLVRRACGPPRLAANVVLDGEVCVVANLDGAVHGLANGVRAGHPIAPGRPRGTEPRRARPGPHASQPRGGRIPLRLAAIGVSRRGPASSASPQFHAVTRPPLGLALTRFLNRSAPGMVRCKTAGLSRIYVRANTLLRRPAGHLSKR